jgi:hypothetical protein
MNSPSVNMLKCNTKGSSISKLRLAGLGFQYSEAELLAINEVLQLSAAEDSMFWASKFLSNQIQQLQNFVAYMHLNMEVISDA